MPAKKGRKRAKLDGELNGQRGNEVKLKRLTKTAVMRECHALTRAKAALDVKEAIVDAMMKAPAKVSKIVEKEKNIEAQKQTLLLEQTWFAMAKKRNKDCAPNGGHLF